MSRFTRIPATIGYLATFIPDLPETSLLILDDTPRHCGTAGKIPLPVSFARPNV